MNRDDAVKALDAALTNMQKGGRYTPEDVDDLERCARDVLDLLKVQEPRVMTLEEALGGDECWVEYPNGGCGYADCYLSYTGNGADIYRTMQHDLNVALKDYGRTWRCWTSRPTDEQREAEPWMT